MRIARILKATLALKLNFQPETFWTNHALGSKASLKQAQSCVEAEAEAEEEEEQGQAEEAELETSASQQQSAFSLLEDAEEAAEADGVLKASPEDEENLAVSIAEAREERPADKKGKKVIRKQQLFELTPCQIHLQPTCGEKTTH